VSGSLRERARAHTHTHTHNQTHTQTHITRTHTGSDGTSLRAEVPHPGVVNSHENSGTFACIRDSFLLSGVCI